MTQNTLPHIPCNTLNSTHTFTALAHINTWNYQRNIRAH